MKFPNMVRTRVEAKVLVELAFPRPPGYGIGYGTGTWRPTTLEVTTARMAQENTLRLYLEWIMGAPKLYKVTRRDLSYGAVERFSAHMHYFLHAFSCAYAREKGPLRAA
ncbi:MAG: hypothetical protein QOE70_4009 [Chthoniobacter sp.]|jgi:hypothetical protein|nr:hypothetical protein [Chthoniobacter sp.]